MNQDKINVYERIENYLDGLLNEEKTRRFEQDLLKEDVATLFREVLLMRELLRELPPAEPPEGLAQRIEDALSVAPTSRKAPEIKSEEKPRGFWSMFRSGFRWPAYLLAGMPGSTGALRNSVNGLRTIGYAIGPLKEPMRKGADAVRRSGKPLWKYALINAAKGVLS
jgi:anti-sigma factor RsiW